MADVISDRSSTNGGLKEDIDEIKLNGDKSDSLVEPEEEADNDASSEACISKKVMSDVNAVDKLHELKEKSSITIANGHILSSESPDTKSKSSSQNSENNESPTAESAEISATQPEPSTDQPNDDDISGEIENDDEEVEQEEEEDEDDDEEEEDDDVEDANDCDSGPLNFAQNNKRADDSEDVLNLKASGDSADGSCPKKEELRKTTDDKTESSSAATEASEDASRESDADHPANKSGDGTSDLNKTVDDQENDPLASDSSSAQKKKSRSRVPAALDITPRRSSRNLNKQKNYSEKELLDFENNAVSITPSPHKSKTNEDDEIEEVTPTDPLADDTKLRMRPNKTIVVSDTKGLVEFATSAKMPRSNKKEPTLVIIDTNSILSGRGPVPISQSGSSTSIHSVSGSAPIPVSLPIPAGSLATRGLPPSTSAFSVIPIGIPSQGMYSQYKNPPPQMKPIVVGPASTTVTPITIQSVSSMAGTTSQLSSSVTITGMGPATSQNTSNSSSKQQPPVILPSLTDDMFVVEAPSFIVPYVYEKPPMKSLKDYIDKIAAEVQEAKEKEKQEREEKEKLEREEKEKQEKEEREKAEKERAEAEEKKKAEEKAEEGDGDAASKDESMEVDGEAKSAEKTTSEDADSEKKDEPSDKDTVLQMEVDEEADPDAAKVTSETDKVLSSSKKVSEATTPAKKEEPVTPAASTPAAATPKDEKKVEDAKKQPLSYFDNPLGKFFMQIGLNLVQEHVQTDLLRSQKRKRDKEGDKCSPDVKLAIETLSKTLESSKENNDPFKLELRKCELCSFKTESILVMAHHLETPHMKNYTYRCNFCPFEVRSPHDILFHMESEHNIRGRLERAPAFHQCPNCPFEDNQKGKLTRHMVSCAKKYRPERNQEPPLDWEPPAKIPRVTRNRPPSMSPGNAVYQAAMSGLKQVPQNTLLPKLMPNAASANLKQPPNLINMNKRPNAVPPNFVHRFPNSANQQGNFQQRPISVQGANQGLMYRNPGTNSQTQVILPQNYQLSGAQIYQQNQSAKHQAQMQQGLAAAKLLNQPSISITPLPRQTPSSQPSTSSPGNMNMKPGKPPGPGNKNSFVVCEICDSGIKDLEQLRNHMQWIHKVKIHPKMIYNRPPLNCQKCQFRFFTDQGLERHLLGSHGLVTSSMQEAANKGKDSGRCPVCGRVYQWKLLNHVARDHSMALKPAHLSYKCTVCTATFGMYKQFESHVYSAHSVVAKRAMDPKKPPVIPTSSQNDALLKPLKINDEITIIPQPVRVPKPPNKPPPPNSSGNSGSKGKDDQLPSSDTVDECDRRAPDVVVIDSDDDDDFEICTKPCVAADFASEDEYRRHMLRHVRPLAIQVPKIDLSRFQPVPNRPNSFRLSKKPGPAFVMSGRQVLVGGFRVEVTDLSCLSEDFVYHVVQHVVDPALLEPIVLLYVVDASGRFHFVSGVERMTVSSVNNVYHHPDHHYIAATPCPAAAVPAASSYQKPEQRSPMSTMEELAAKYGLPVDYLVDVTRSFGSSHFLLNSPLSQLPVLPKPPKPRNRYTPRQPAPIKRAPSDVVVLRNADGSKAISGEINLAQTSRIVTGPISNVTTVVASPLTGALANNLGSRFLPTSASSATSTIGRSLLTKALLAPRTTSMTSTTSGSITRVQVIDGGSLVTGPDGPKSTNRIRLLASKAVPAAAKLLKAAAARMTGAGNPLVMKRVPLSVRQPPYPKRVPAESKSKDELRPLDPVFVPVERDPLASSDDEDAPEEVIDLLSDDEVVEKKVDENDAAPKGVDENEIGPTPNENGLDGAKDVVENDAAPKAVNENLSGLQAVVDDDGQKVNNSTAEGGDDEFEILDLVEEVIEVD